MSNWNNYGVKFTNEEAYIESQKSIRDEFIIHANDEELVIELTDFATGEDMSVNDLKQRLRQQLGSISSVIHVRANDTDDTASGTAYDVDGRSFEMARTQHSGNPDSRYNWPGLSYDGMRVSGAKY